MRGFALALGGAIAVAASARAEPPPCETWLRVEPSDAFVGQQIHYGLEIQRRPDVRAVHWARPFSAPGFRVESLPTRTGVQRDPSAGGRSLGIEERRALFPTRAGELEIPPARLRCSVAAPPGEIEFDVDVPAAVVRVAEIPEAGRPDGYEGLVGAVTVRSWVEPHELSLGGSLRLSVLVEGAANLWELGDPLDAEALSESDVDLLVRPSELARDAARGLRLRRYYFYDLVPRRSGGFEIPALTIPWFDPRSARFSSAQAPALRIEVRPTPAEPVRAAPKTLRKGEATPTRTPEPRRQTRLELLLAGLAGSAALALLFVLWRRRRRDPWREIEAVLQQAAASRAQGNTGAANDSLARALRLALERSLPGARACTAEELRARARGEAALETAAELVGQLDAERFSGKGTVPDAETVRHAALQAARGRRLLPSGTPNAR